MFDCTLIFLLLGSPQGVSAVHEAMKATEVDTITFGSAGLNAGKDATTAAVIAASAVRYFDLSHSRRTNYAFSYEKVLALRGNTAVYVMYAVSRLRALRRQCAATMMIKESATASQQWKTAVEALRVDAADCDVSTLSTSLESSERQLALTVLRFPEALAIASRSLSPHFLTAHAHELAGCFHSFYSSCRILPTIEVDKPESGVNTEQQWTRIPPAVTIRRLVLCAAVEHVLVDSCGLLGIECLDHI